MHETVFFLCYYELITGFFIQITTSLLLLTCICVLLVPLLDMQPEEAFLSDTSPYVRKVNPKKNFIASFFSSAFFQLFLTISSLVEYHAWVMKRIKYGCRLDSLICLYVFFYLFAKINVQIIG